MLESHFLRELGSGNLARGHYSESEGVCLLCVPKTAFASMKLGNIMQSVYLKHERGWPYTLSNI